MAQPVAQCPRCRQTMVANVQQIFDLARDPQAKQKLLSGQFNTAVCSSCGYASPLGTPLVYHDPEKQLFLTYYPAELNTPLPEQERILGQLIRSVVDALPAEKRGGYLFQPRSMYSYDTLLDTILEADGITKEMIQAEERKISLLRQLLSADDNAVPGIIDQDLTPYDDGFFALLANVQGNAEATGNEALIQKAQLIQNELLEKTEYGRELKIRAESTRKAIADLQALGENLNRDTLLDLVAGSQDDAYLHTIVGLARNGMDYRFFETLTAKIDAAAGAEKDRLSEIREKTLAAVREIDASIQEQKKLRKQALEAILKADHTDQAVEQYARAIDDAFLEVAGEELENARKEMNYERSGKIQALIDKVQEMMKVPPELEFLQSLMKIEDISELTAAIENNRDAVTDDFKEMLETVIENISGAPDTDPKLLERLKTIRTVLAA